MDEQWIAKSLTVWGVIITTITGLLPAINALLALKGWSITPEWLGTLNTSVQALIQAFGMLVGVIMVAYDRVSGGVKKTLVLLPNKNYTLEFQPKPKAQVSPGVQTKETPAVK